MGYAACFDNALPVAAKQLKLAPTATKTSVEVGIGQNAEGGYSLDIDLYVEVQGLAKPTRRSWWKPPTKSARTRTPPAATSTCACTPASPKRR
jgi:hypothetical protein